MKHALYFVLMLLCVLLWSCETSPLLSIDDEAETVVVSISAQISPITLNEKQNQEEAITNLPDQHSTLYYDARIYQFDSNGNRIHITPPQPIAVTGGQTLTLPPFPLMQGENQTMILLFSFEDQDLTQLNKSTTLSEFCESSVEWTLDHNQDHSLLISRLDSVSVSPHGIASTDGNSLFRLKRAGCRIDFTYSFEVEGYTLKQIRLNNIPRRMALLPESPLYPNIENDTHLSSFTLDVENKTGSFQWFLPANARGTGANHSGDQKLKIAANAPDDFCTHLQMECVNNIDQEIVRFNLYLGGDPLNDFSLKANHAYRVSANLKGLDDTDFRIEGSSMSETWFEVADLEQMHGNKKIEYIRYTLSNGSTRDYKVQRTLGNRFYYRLSKSQFPAEEALSHKIKGIELLDHKGGLLSLNTSGLHKIPGEGDALIPHTFDFLRAGVSYNWTFQGIINKRGELEVCTPRTLSNVNRILNGDFKQVDHIDFAGAPVWNPIGSATAPFIGRYVGDGYKIERLVWSEGEHASMGLFGILRNAVVDGVYIASGCLLTGNARTMGAIAGEATHTIISRCSNHARIYNGSDRSDSRTGGIVGSMYGGYFSDCYNMGSLHNQWYYNGTGAGIAGTVENPEGYLNNSYNKGRVYEFQGNDDNRGAIIGKGESMNPFLIVNCFTNSDSYNHLMGTPRRSDNMLTDTSGLGQYNNKGMKDPIFSETLNSGGSGSEWDQSPYRNNGYPYLRIEKE